jgi:hypothetical protein
MRTAPHFNERQCAVLQMLKPVNFDRCTSSLKALQEEWQRRISVDRLHHRPSFRVTVQIFKDLEPTIKQPLERKEE